MIVDLVGKRGRIRTVALPTSAKLAIDEWTSAAGITNGRLLRPLSKGDHILPGKLCGWAIWSVVVASAKTIGIEHFGAHDMRRTSAKLCRQAGGELEQIQFMLGHASIQTTETCLGSEQQIAVAVNDRLRF